MRCSLTKKVKHNSKNDAEAAHKNMHNKVLINTFFCKHCGGWHLGHSRNLNRFQKFIDEVIKKDKNK